MKKIALTISILFFVSTIFAQLNYQWDKSDSISKTKIEIYSLTKLFISEYWKSAQDVIQNDDKEGGVILVKGISNKFTFNSMGATYAYTYSYNVTFRMKDSKYKFTIDNVKYYSTAGSSFDNKLIIEPHELDNCPYKNKKFGEKCNQIMTSLKSELQSIADNYENTIKSAKKTGGDW